MPDDRDPQPTVLLHHVLDEGSHYDWLIARPGQDRLWTARVADLSSRWADLGRFELIELPPHRRKYLTYEGPISKASGSSGGGVTRVDEGSVVIQKWDADAATLDVTLRNFRGSIRLTRLDGDRWRADVG